MTDENLSSFNNEEDIFKQDCVLMEHRFDHRWDDVYCDYTTVQVKKNLLLYFEPTKFKPT